MVRTSLPHKLICHFQYARQQPGITGLLRGPGALHYSSRRAVVGYADLTSLRGGAVWVRGAGLWRMKTSGERASSPQ